MGSEAMNLKDALSQIDDSAGWEEWWGYRVPDKLSPAAAVGRFLAAYRERFGAGDLTEPAYILCHPDLLKAARVAGELATFESIPVRAPLGREPKLADARSFWAPVSSRWEAQS